MKTKQIWFEDSFRQPLRKSRHPKLEIVMVKYLFVIAVVTVSVVAIAAEKTPQKEQVVSSKTEQLTNKLHDHVDSLENRLSALKDRVEALPGQSEKALQDHLAKARSKVDEQ